MADGELTMFGKAYDTVGSTNKNLVLLTRGDLKVRWGNKFIDLIKNGKINVDVDLLKKVDSKDNIVKDGIYLIENENNSEVWLSIGDSLVNLLGEIGKTYVSYVGIQEVTVDEKFMALSNIGFFYQSLEDVKTAGVLKGLVYIIDLLKLYCVNGEEITEYIPTFNIPDPFAVGSVTIDGKGQTVSGASKLLFNLSNKTYISLFDEKTQFSTDIITEASIYSEDYNLGKTGYSIYFDPVKNWYCAEFDYIKVRQLLEYEDIIDVKYKELRSIISTGTLIPKMKYRITDFLNEWDINGTEVYEDHLAVVNGVTKVFQLNIFPIVVTAKTLSTLEETGYFDGHPEWIIKYDPNFYYYIEDYTDDKNVISHLYTKGRITELLDEHGNICNFDFKHRMFKHTSNSDDINLWFFTFNMTNEEKGTITSKPYLSRNTRMYKDATLELNTTVENNIIFLLDPVLKDVQISNGGTTISTKLYIKDTDYIIFRDCSLHPPHDNNIINVVGRYEVIMDFDSNIIKGLILNEELLDPYTINYEFTSNNTDDIYITGDPLTTSSVPASFENTTKHTTFTQSLVYSGNTFGDISNTEFKNRALDNVFNDIKNCLFDTPLEDNTFDELLENVEFKCTEMIGNHITGIINTDNARSTYPIKVAYFNNNTINNITKSSIESLTDITGNTIHDIVENNIKGELVNNQIYDIISALGYTSQMLDVTLTNNIMHVICGCDLNKCTIENCIFYDEQIRVYYDLYYSHTDEVSITDSIFKCHVYYTYFKGNVASSFFYKKIGDTSANQVIFGKITDTTFRKEVKGLTADSSELDSCEFRGIINSATIEGVLRRCNFEGLSLNITVQGPLENMNIQVDITPSSAHYVLDANNPSILNGIATLMIDTSTVPRLNNSVHKECFLKIIQGKDAFIVQLSTDDNTPSGTIVMFYPGPLGEGETLADKIPSGYVICDGTNGTPNLLGKFIRAASDYNDVGDHANSDLETNGAGTRQAYLKKTLKHTHTFKTYNTNLTANTTNFNIGYASGTSLEVNISNLGITIDNETLVQTYYYEKYGTHVINDIVQDSSAATTTWIGSLLSSTGLEHNHTGRITGTATVSLPAIQVSGSITVPINYTPEQETTETGFVDAINVEPLAYALIFIMKL